MLQLQFQLLPETLFISINLIDRYLSEQQVPIDKLQLLGVTSMFIAAKFQEIYPPVLSDFVTCANGIYKDKELLAMEFKVLTVVKFDVNCTPSQTFLENYCRAIRVNIPRVLIYASYLLDLSLLKAEFLSIETSHLTLVALSIAIRRE